MAEDRAGMWRNVEMDGNGIVMDGQSQCCFGLVHQCICACGCGDESERRMDGWMDGWIVGATSGNNNSACQNGCFHQHSIYIYTHSFQSRLWSNGITATAGHVFLVRSRKYMVSNIYSCQ